MDHELISNLNIKRPHVVLLGAGASRAAFPEGDASGKLIPLMTDLVPTLELDEEIRSAGLQSDMQDFEALFGQIAVQPELRGLVDSVERRVYEYFSALSLPSRLTLYDHLLLSLRAKDVVATFNWDPFLFDAYWRNAHLGSALPHVLFLHGCVRIGVCSKHGLPGRIGDRCRKCSEGLNPVGLLYPVGEKDYISDRFVKGQWHNFKVALQDAMIFTIFGYAAPKSDAAAVSLMEEAWWRVRHRKLEQVELINIAPEAELLRSWAPFITSGHYDVRTSFYDSWAARFPRRSCEAFWDQYMEMRLRDPYPISGHADPCELAQFLKPLIDAEDLTR